VSQRDDMTVDVGVSVIDEEGKKGCNVGSVVDPEN
jgi:hypothetical protein